MNKRAAIKAISSYLPAGKLTNEQLAEEFGDWHASQILSKTGVAVRGVAASDECASDLGVAAARRLFEGSACSPDEIDFLVFCTQSPDYFTPTTACVMQDRLGLKTSCGAIDINQGCSGYVYGLALAKSLVEAGTAENVLLITADTYTKFINRRDRSLLTLFGDGAAATLVGSVARRIGIDWPICAGNGRTRCKPDHCQSRRTALPADSRDSRRERGSERKLALRRESFHGWRRCVRLCLEDSAAGNGSIAGEVWTDSQNRLILSFRIRRTSSSSSACEPR